MFTIIVHAANEAESFIQKAKTFARLHFFKKENVRVLVRNAEAYNPKQHEPADAIITMPQHEDVIANYEERETHVIVATEEELDKRLSPTPFREAPQNSKPPAPPKTESAPAAPATTEAVAPAPPAAPATSDPAAAAGNAPADANAGSPAAAPTTPPAPKSRK